MSRAICKWREDCKSAQREAIRVIMMKANNLYECIVTIHTVS